VTREGRVVPVHAVKANIGRRSTALLIIDLCTSWMWVVICAFLTTALRPGKKLGTGWGKDWMRPRNRSGYFLQKDNLLPLQEIGT